MESTKAFLIFFIVASVVTNNRSDALKILGIFPVAVKSHFVVGEELMKVLAEKGHQVDVVNHFPQNKALPNYADISLAGTLPGTLNNITIGDTKNLSTLFIGQALQNVGLTVCDLLSHRQLQALLKKPKNSYDVIIIGMFSAHCYLAFGQHFNASVVGLIPSKMHDWLYAPLGNPFNTAYMGGIFTSYTQEMTFYERLVNTFIANMMILHFNYHIEDQRYYVEKYFGRKLSSIQDLYDDISILFVNSHYSIGEIRPQTPDVIDIGGLHVQAKSELPANIKKWLNDSTEGCVYISFGSMVRIETLPADKLEAFYEMFRRIAPVRVLMKIADPKLLPPNLPKNVKTLSWLPQLAVLKHENTKVFITHGGQMGTQESAAWGVPMVGIPLFGDQKSNIQTYARKKIAVALDLNTFNAESLTNAVETVLNDPEYSKNVKEIAALFWDRITSPAETAVWYIEFSARHGNRLKSPARKLTWWQFYLLDVFGFIIGSLIIILYIFKKILDFIFRFFCSRKTSATSIKSKKNI